MSAPASDPTLIRRSSTLWYWLIGFLLIGILVRWGAAVFLPTIERPDEVFQNLEPAYRLWTGEGVVTWEWRDGIRSWIFPGMLYGVMQATTLLHLPSSTAVPLIWLLLSIVAAGVIAVGVVLGWRRFGVTGAILGGLLTAFWPDLIYYGPKTLGEVQAGNLVVLAAALASLGPSRARVWRLVLIGVLLGAAFDLRFQLAASFVVIACWAARLDIRRSWLPLIVGAAIPLLLLGGVDWWTLGTPFQSIWKNIQVNLVEHKAEYYGVQPMYRYLTILIFRNGAAAVALLGLFLYGFRSAPLLASTSIVIVGFHSLIAHKEISFIYAALPCAMVVVALGAARVVVTLPAWLKRPPGPRVATAIAAALAVMVMIAVDLSERPFLQPGVFADLIGLYKIARSEPDLCALGMVETNGGIWYASGGHTFLGRPVPIYLAKTLEAVEQSKAEYNYAITQRSFVGQMSRFNLIDCRNDVCLLHRPAGCVPGTAYEISGELIKAHE